MSRLRDEIEGAINSCSAENGSNTPDFILARYLVACLKAFDDATQSRDDWYKVHLEPANSYFENIRMLPELGRIKQLPNN